jgi:hypothetical protein
MASRACKDSVSVWAGNSKLVGGGGGFPVTPPYTAEKFWELELQDDTADSPDLLDALGIRMHGPHSQAPWLLLTDKRSKLRDIFALETAMVTKGDELEWGLWRLPMDHHPSPSQITRLASSRGLVRCIAGPCASPQELVGRIEALRLSLQPSVRWTLHHEKLSRLSTTAGGREGEGEESEEDEEQVQTAQMAAAVARVIQGGQAGFGSKIDARCDSRMHTRPLVLD